MLTSIYHTPQLAVYQIKGEESPLLNRYIISSPDTREICNDPQICGIEYTRKLQKVCRLILESLSSFTSLKLVEDHVVVFNTLKNSLNFGLREALSDAYEWNFHETIYTAPNQDFAQSLVENYKPFLLPQHAQIIIGDIVSDATIIKAELDALIENAIHTGAQIETIILFVIGGNQLDTALMDISAKCVEHFTEFSHIEVFYMEGCFTVPKEDTSLSIKKVDQDLTRKGALMAPEFIQSQYELPFYSIERSVEYNGDLRANNILDFIEEVCSYWEHVRAKAMEGMTFEELLKERFPEIDATKFGKQNLISLAEQHITKLKRIV